MISRGFDLQVDSDSISERQSRSSGCGSAHDSISWHHTSRSEISNSDSGAELEPPVMNLSWQPLPEATKSGFIAMTSFCFGTEFTQPRLWRL